MKTMTTAIEYTGMPADLSRDGIVITRDWEMVETEAPTKPGQFLFAREGENSQNPEVVVVFRTGFGPELAITCKQRGWTRLPISTPGKWFGITKTDPFTTSL